MQDIFNSIYSWFESLFGSNLSEYLSGYNCVAEDYSNPNMFNQVGLIMFFISLATALGYYYVLNHPRYSQWWHWLIAMLLTALINLFVAYGWVHSGFKSGVIGDCIMYTRDAAGNIISQLTRVADCWMFGVTNAIVSAGFFIVLSFIFKWWSSNAKHSPF
jgi:hypothetical protein